MQKIDSNQKSYNEMYHTSAEYLDLLGLDIINLEDELRYRQKCMRLAVTKQSSYAPVQLVKQESAPAECTGPEEFKIKRVESLSSTPIRKKKGNQSMKSSSNSPCLISPSKGFDALKITTDLQGNKSEVVSGRRNTLNSEILSALGSKNSTVEKKSPLVFDMVDGIIVLPEEDEESKKSSETQNSSPMKLRLKNSKLKN
eukprot:CAMPEP_0114602100 /NCGR_PEP_ID=MMETSP0125-20121206/24727_1 /TAXON_ID=485358 ORGANISM="Aristerostoma sp., Strain ATCC 50986" /NCGR_SAMPLE_ID=MMETSP0125 /ASSEMBLY_ACC=CAM_ASM_000245 /LENGTH=198 /DNA_ID=CAMNT_0001812007 /DNA_START=246 /DNA_END=842 /DNA_ORIENTATION=-